ncbi:glycosyltransferase family 2 protein [Streptomyces sp. NPDC091290]|uniref:glycosyltransferase family 2 protein n=1 Tax=Streptomyces sp. NPDC091290 TaxID=3365990 RepID=UPI00381A9C20
MPVKVSVVVPVYNPGAHIEECVASLLRQSLPPDAYEVIFVDDGSTDGTGERLDELAAADPRVRVFHQENSGWSGKPRNVGIDAARGTYVMFVDNDDHLGDEALERMYAYGTAHDADVVVGKMAGLGRGVPVELFRRDRPRATVANAPLIDSLTPHKMFRRAFLDATGLRFPEGRRRLEDHVFVTEAFLRAGNVAVLSDYVCYYHVRRDDSSNAGFQRFDPVGYFKNLREALDVVERYTGPGPLRDRLFRRWLRVEMVERMRGRRLLDLPPDHRRELFAQMHEVVVERFGPGVAAGLQPTQQVVAALIAAGRCEAVEEFAGWEAGVTLTARPEQVVWEDGVLRVGFTAEYAVAGAPMTFAADADRIPLDGPPADLAAAVAWVGADTVARFGEAGADLLLRERTGGARYFQPVEVTRERIPEGDGGRIRLVLRARATMDPAALAGAGLWDAVVRVKLGGWTKECRLGPAPGPGRPAPYAALAGGHVVLPYWTSPHACLALDVDRATRRAGLGALTPDDVTVTDGRLRARLPLHVPGQGAEASLRLEAAGTGHDVPAALTPHGEGALLVAELPPGRPRGGTWRLALGVPGPRLLPLPVALRVRAGRVRVVRTPGRGALRRLARGARRRLRGTPPGRTAARVRALIRGR